MTRTRNTGTSAFWYKLVLKIVFGNIIQLYVLHNLGDWSLLHPGRRVRLPQDPVHQPKLHTGLISTRNEIKNRKIYRRFLLKIVLKFFWANHGRRGTGKASTDVSSYEIGITKCLFVCGDFGLNIALNWVEFAPFRISSISKAKIMEIFLSLNCEEVNWRKEQYLN